jgi:hypothetical protein
LFEKHKKHKKNWDGLGYFIKQVEEMDIPGVDDAKRVGRKLDWVPAEAERPALATIGDAEVEKRALVRFALFTALRERRVTPREVSIV